MIQKTYVTPLGSIVYYRTGTPAPGRPVLVFLPGLTADHRLFEKQIDHFRQEYDCLVWDAPGHGASRPFELSFTLADKAYWLKQILKTEGIEHPVLIGQSMGGYVSQSFMEHYPGEAAGFIAVDSAPLQKKYMSGLDNRILGNTGPMFRAIPWEFLKKAAVEGVSETLYGRLLMHSFIRSFTREEYIRLSAHGYRILAEAVSEDRPYKIDCPALLICGKKDNAGYVRRYNKAWHRETGIPICWIEKAGHNSNTDRPDEVNALIEGFLNDLRKDSSGEETDGAVL